MMHAEARHTTIIQPGPALSASCTTPPNAAVQNPPAHGCILKKRAVDWRQERAAPYRIARWQLEVISEEGPKPSR